MADTHFSGPLVSRNQYTQEIQTLDINYALSLTTITRPSGSYSRFFYLNDGGAGGTATAGSMTGTAAQKTYAMEINCARPSTSVATGDSNDAVLKLSYNNHAANDSNFIMRGLNIGINNRSGGQMGTFEGASIGAQGKSGGTIPTIRGLSVIPENYGTCATEFGGVDVVLKNEGAQATLSYGLRVRSTEASGMAAIGAAVLVSNTSTNGFTYGVDLNGATIGTADIRLSNGGTIGTSVALTPVRPAGAYAYLFYLNDGGGGSSPTVGAMTGTTAQKTYGLSVNLNRPSTSVATGDSNDALLRLTGNNHAANDSNFILRGINSSINNRSGGTMGTMEGGSIGAQGKSGGTIPTLRGLTVTPENYGTCATEFGGIDVVLKNEANTATTTYGMRIRNIDASAQAAIAAALLITATATNGFTYGIDLNGTTVGTADLRLHNGATIQNGSAAVLTITEGTINLVGAVGLGSANTDEITCTGRLIMRTTASDPKDGTPGNRPAGSLKELVYYNGKLYFCTNASTPTWEQVTSA